MKVVMREMLSHGVGISLVLVCVFFVIIRRPPRSTQSRSSAASDVYKRQLPDGKNLNEAQAKALLAAHGVRSPREEVARDAQDLSLIHISEPTRPY